MYQKLGFVIDNKELMLDWDYAKNDAEGLDPNVLTCGSTKIAHWKCHICGNEYTTRIERKSKGSKCKKCLAKELTIAPKERSLKTLFPDIAKEWNYKLNLMTPDTVYPNSNLPYWWTCPNGHDYQMPASKRTGRNDGCPICSNKIVVAGINDLQSNYPELMEEWDKEKNDEIGLDPSKISYGSKERAFWKCKSKGHTWRAAIYSRTTGRTGCPKCNKELKTSYPEKIVAYYMSSLFEDVKENYTYEDLGKLELDVYIPSLKIGIEYDGSRWHKTLKNDLKKDLLCNQLGIKMIRVREVGCFEYESNSLKLHIKEKNDKDLEKAIIEIVNYINKEFEMNLVCDINIERDGAVILSKVLTRIKQNSIGNSPLIDEWDWIKNEGIDPNFVALFSNKKYWWKCKEHNHSWKASPSHRARGRNCPYCSGQKVLEGFNDLQSQFQDIAKEWDQSKNNKKPNEVTSKSNKSYWWICSKCGHKWKTRIYVRTAMGCGCPKCSGKEAGKKNRARKVQTIGSLRQTNPELAAEFHPTRNGELTPDNITAGSNQPIWWLCSKCNYAWKQAPGIRKQGAGCPHCAGRVPFTGVDDLLTINPDLCKEWDYSKNKILPSEVLPGSGEKVWWNCSKCGNNWQTEVRVRAILGCGCPKCGHLKTLEASYRKVRNIDTGKIYKCIAEATKEFGLSRTSISNCLSKKSKTAGGYRWEYVD